jgi:DNA-binding beta-propeller fold protein YncE
VRQGGGADNGRTAVGLRGLSGAARLRGRRVIMAAGVLAVVAAGAVCAPAFALSQRGHVFGFAFAGGGSGAGQLSGPAGVAVSESTGDVYVVDSGNNRIERFAPEGKFIAAWGWGVKDGASEYQVCESACLPGIAGPNKGQLRSPGSIAVDNSASGADPSRGDVYVIADTRSEHGRLAKFTAEGEPLTPLRQTGSQHWEGTLDGVAVDGGGGVWVYRDAEAQGVIERFGSAAKNQFEEPALESPVHCPKPGFAVDAAGEHLYVAHERENHEEACPAEEGETARPVVVARLTRTGEVLEAPLGALDPLQSAAVGTEAATGDAYVSNVGSFSAFSAEGGLIQRLSLPGSGPAGTGIAADGATGRIYVADAANEKIDVFVPEPAGAPSVSGLQAMNLTPSSARLSAQVDPHGADTHFYFQYGTANCVSSPALCSDVPAAPGTDIGAGFGDQAVSVELPGLKASTTYYYRLLASNGHGEAEGAETFGSITTLPTAQGLLPDGRAWELVSPPEKDGSGIEPLRKEGGLIQASEAGDAITYVANGPIVPEPEGNRAPYPTQAIAKRGSTGWSSQQIVTPRTKGEGFIR